jgi:hypothetical protein
MAEVGLLARVVAGARARLGSTSPAVRVCRTADDLVGLDALDLVLVPGATEPIPAFLGARFLAVPPPPAPPSGVITWRRSEHRFWAPRPLVPSKYDWREV